MKAWLWFWALVVLGIGGRVEGAGLKKPVSVNAGRPVPAGSWVGEGLYSATLPVVDLGLVGQTLYTPLWAWNELGWAWVDLEDALLIPGRDVMCLKTYGETADVNYCFAPPLQVLPWSCGVSHVGYSLVSSMAVWMWSSTPVFQWGTTYSEDAYPATCVPLVNHATDMAFVPFAAVRPALPPIVSVELPAPPATYAWFRNSQWYSAGFSYGLWKKTPPMYGASEVYAVDYSFRWFELDGSLSVDTWEDRGYFSLGYNGLMELEPEWFGLGVGDWWGQMRYARAWSWDRQSGALVFNSTLGESP